MPKTIPLAEAHAQRLLPLLREYAEKAKAITASLERDEDGDESRRERPLARERRMAQRHEYMRRMIPALRQLTGMSSQFVEYGDVDDVTKVELRLRLAELEYSMSNLEHRF